MARAILLSCETVSKSYGDRPLFDGLTFTLHEGDHVGLVGPNGAGKSTLLKILAGTETPDGGTCTRQKSLRVSYVPQHPVFPAGATAAAIVGEALAGARLEDYERSQRVSVALSRAGIAEQDVAADTLSGGWRARLAIARALVTEPDILLLDEPTNHLDLDSIVWLEALLASEPRAFVVISHDRYFLQNVASRMLEIDRVYPGGLLAVSGSYAELLEARAENLANQASAEQSLATRVRREVAWLRQGAKARRTKSKARIEAAGRSIEALAASRERSAVATVGIEFTASGRKTKRLWWCEALAKSFGDTAVVSGLDLVLIPGMRLGVLGANGSGKTTLLRMIAGELAPDGGTIGHAEGLRVVYFDQKRASLDPQLSLKRALAPDGDSVWYRDRAVHVTGWAKRFRFRPEQLETQVSRLSGGERARLIVARLMLQPADLLILDEPTNDLDLSTLDELEDSLLDFPGALVLVSHDRHLIDRVATEIVALDGRGGIERYADCDQWQAARRVAAAEPKGRPEAAGADKRRTRVKALPYLEQRELDAIEARIASAESRAEQAQARVEDPAIASDAAALERRLAELAEARGAVDALWARWAELEGKLK